jgi:hypothetical protein
MMPLRVAVVYWARSKHGTTEIRKSKGSTDNGLFKEGITAPEHRTSKVSVDFQALYTLKMAAWWSRCAHCRSHMSAGLRSEICDHLSEERDREQSEAEEGRNCPCVQGGCLQDWDVDYWIDATASVAPSCARRA